LFLFRAFLGTNENVFVCHRAFVRAKPFYDYTGTIEPPYTSTAFANMGDAQGATLCESQILTFVEFCREVGNHLKRAASCTMLQRRASSAMQRLAVVELAESQHVIRLGAGHPALVPNNMCMQRRCSVNALVPFVRDQESTIRMAESLARLIFVNDDRLGILSERQFRVTCREISITTGVKIHQSDARNTLRYTRGRGGVALEFMCALFDISKSDPAEKPQQHRQRSMLASGTLPAACTVSTPIAEECEHDNSMTPLNGVSPKRTSRGASRLDSQ